MHAADTQPEPTRGTPAVADLVVETRGHDPLLFDMERLAELASAPVVARGVTYFKEQRVTDIGWRDRRLWATVEGSLPNQPYEVAVEADAEGELDLGCSCPYDWEPACKHVVAALLAYAARQPVSDAAVDSAADAAVADRMRRGRTEVRAVHVAGEPTFGTWEAQSVVPRGVIARTYTVSLRSVDERINHCTCPDFATNRLGTCKHVEAVVHRAKKRRGGRGRAGAAGRPAALVVPVVYLAWDVADAPRVRVRRGTCAGAILMARETTCPAQRSFNFIDIAVERNAYGRQIDSAIRRLSPEREFVERVGEGEVEAVFIRAPIIRAVGPKATVLLRDGEIPVLVEQGGRLAATFHPELTSDRRVHRLWLEKVRATAA